MGTWGTGNFENDGAVIFLLDLCDRLINTIEAVIADDSRFILDEDAEAELMPSIELLALLSEQYGLHPIERKRVFGWQARYLAMYDDYIDSLQPSESFKEQRRAVIAATFERLANVALMKDDS
jgi:hypothetical protein